MEFIIHPYDSLVENSRLYRNLQAESHLKLREAEEEHKKTLTDLANQEREISRLQSRLEQLPDIIKTQIHDKIETELKTRYGELAKRVESLQARSQKRKELIYPLAKRMRNLEKLKKHAVLETAITRLRRGEKSTYLHCPEAAGIIAQRYDALLADYNQLSQERDDLRTELAAISSHIFELALANQEAIGKFSENFSVLYIDNKRRISYASEGIEQYLGMTPEGLIGKRPYSLLRLVLDKDKRKKLLASQIKSESRYTKVKISTQYKKHKLDVMLKILEGPHHSNVGTIVYVRKHRLLQNHRPEEHITNLMESTESILSKIAQDAIIPKPKLV